MNLRTPLAAMVAAAALVITSGCAVTRGQETTGAYIDDAAISTQVKAKMVEDKNVDAAAIKVDTLNGEVMLSGFAKNSVEKNTAESIAMKVKGVKSVKNQIVVRP
jgi:osmotically-inducible protein OsmY